jgi:signal transduction histidine kinase
VIDDNHAIHADYHKVLDGDTHPPGQTNLEDALFGTSAPTIPCEGFEIASAFQGAEGLLLVEQALASGDPFALAFVDVRMPPGWDGLETTARIWAVDPDIQIVLCTAYLDYSWEETIAKVGQSDRLLILKKPFANIEVLQLANALTEKWRLLQESKARTRELQQRVDEHREREEIARRALAHEHELSKVKSTFVTMVSHEFRTPLGVIGGSAQLLSQYSERMTREERTSCLFEIESAVDRMTRMMEELLFHGKLGEGTVTRKPSRMNTGDVCRALAGEVSHCLRREFPVEYSISPEAWLVCLDETLVRHIIGNLLSNAVKYSDGNRLVKVDVSIESGVSGERAEHVLFRISDSGIGIPTADLPKLFQTFHRGANIGNRPGTGIGLAIVKQCVEIHGGSVKVESQEGVGTTFTVRLPSGEAVTPDSTPVNPGKH